MNHCVLEVDVLQAPTLRYTQDNQTPIAEMEVVFDIYARPTFRNKIRNWKYFYRFLFKPVPKKVLENIFDNYGKKIYKVHSYLNSLIRKYFFIKLIIRLIKPFYP